MKNQSQDILIVDFYLRHFWYFCNFWQKKNWKIDEINLIELIEMSRVISSNRDETDVSNQNQMSRIFVRVRSIRYNSNSFESKQSEMYKERTKKKTRVFGWCIYTLAASHTDTRTKHQDQYTELYLNNIRLKLFTRFDVLKSIRLSILDQRVTVHTLTQQYEHTTHMHELNKLFLCFCSVAYLTFFFVVWLLFHRLFCARLQLQWYSWVVKWVLCWYVQSQKKTNIDHITF